MAKVLLIEDEKTLREMYATMLDAKGHTALQEANGAGGLSAASSQNPDVILLDYRLPDMNGIDVMQKLKADEKTSSIPIVIFSNYVNEADKEKFLSRGADKVLFKYEMTPAQIVEQIKEYL